MKDAVRPSSSPPRILPPSLLQLLKTEYDTTRIVYNRFVSAISQKPTIATVLSPDVSMTPDLPCPGRFCLPCIHWERSCFGSSQRCHPQADVVSPVS